MSTEFSSILNLDCDRVISLWGEGSVFSSDESVSDDVLGDFFWDLEGIEEDAATLFDYDAPKSSSATGAHALPTPPTRPLMPASAMQQAAPSTATPSYVPSREGWWCVPETMYVKKEAVPRVDRLSAPCASNSTESGVVPDNSCPSSATSHYPANPYGVVPQPYGRFMSMASVVTIAAPLKVLLKREPPSEIVRMRQESLQRYRDKKARRLYTKMIRYRLRKINADKRPRIKGRFVKKEIQEDLATGMALETEGMVGSASPDDDCMSDDSL